ncbi:MAG: zinc-ribbon domain-containing protein [Clostridia bacterium]|nr:zinc-ribbon domain-containing protein [Clostridia bacterium]
MNEILKMLNELSADDLDSLITRANIMLDKKRKEEAEQARLEQERQRQEKLEQEKQRQQEIAELQRRLQELQGQAYVEPAAEKTPVKTESFVAAPKKVPSFYTEPVATAPARPAPAPAQPRPVARIACPSCRTMNAADSRFCEHCGTPLNKAPQPAPQPAATRTPAQPAAPAASVRYAPEGMKKWEMLPGENTLVKRSEMRFLQPKPERKYVYSIEVTDKRILLSRESAASAGMGTAGVMGAGFVGGLIMEGIKAASGAGPKPWIEIPMAAVSNCFVQNKKEIVLVADQTYVFKCGGLEKNLPDMVANLRR